MCAPFDYLNILKAYGITPALDEENIMDTTTIFLVAIPAIIAVIALFVIYSGKQHQKNTVATSIRSDTRTSKKQSA